MEPKPANLEMTPMMISHFNQFAPRSQPETDCERDERYRLETPADSSMRRGIGGPIRTGKYNPNARIGRSLKRVRLLKTAIEKHGGYMAAAVEYRGSKIGHSLIHASAEQLQNFLNLEVNNEHD